MDQLPGSQLSLQKKESRVKKYGKNNVLQDFIEKLDSDDNKSKRSQFDNYSSGTFSDSGSVATDLKSKLQMLLKERKADKKFADSVEKSLKFARSKNTTPEKLIKRPLKTVLQK